MGPNELLPPPLDAASPSVLLLVGVGLSALLTFFFGSVLQNVPLRAAGQNSGSGYNTRVLGYDTARGEVCDAVAATPPPPPSHSS
jgi:hypothetical protein